MIGMKIRECSREEYEADVRSELNKKGLYRAVNDELSYLYDELPKLGYVADGIFQFEWEKILLMIKFSQEENKCKEKK